MRFLHEEILNNALHAMMFKVPIKIAFYVMLIMMEYKVQIQKHTLEISEVIWKKEIGILIVDRFVIHVIQMPTLVRMALKELASAVIVINKYYNSG